MSAHSKSTEAPQAALKSLNLPAPNLKLDVIRAAHRLISPRIHCTPVITCASLDQVAGARLFFKCENLQKTGSFKIRGATNAVFSLTDDQAKFGVAAPSSGNHAAALSQAARWRGIPAYIVMPRNSSQAKKTAVETYGGQITESEPNIASREAVTAEVIKRTGAHLVHPYNDARVIAGQGTAALELLEEIPDLDAVITPLSGGGLLCGTAIAAKSLRPAIRVIGGVRRYARRVQNTSRTAVILNLIHFARREACVHQHRPRIHTGRGQENGHKRPAILPDDHHPIARAHAQATQPRLRVGDGRRQLPIRPGSSALKESRPIRRTLRPRLHDVADADGSGYCRVGHEIVPRSQAPRRKPARSDPAARLSDIGSKAYALASSFLAT